VFPTETTSYVLILEGADSAPMILTRHVVVHGAKGSAGDWPSDIFEPLEYKADFDLSASMVRVASSVRKSLTEDRGYELRQFTDEDNRPVFATAFLEDSRLNVPAERPRRLRRMAARVVLTSQGPGH